MVDVERMVVVVVFVVVEVEIRIFNLFHSALKQSTTPWLYTWPSNKGWLLMY